MKYIGTPEFDGFSLDVWQCSCGFHTGIDGEYFESRTDTVHFCCPKCDCISAFKEDSVAIPREDFWIKEETVQCEPSPEPNT